jgi:hypothetical protein
MRLTRSLRSLLLLFLIITTIGGVESVFSREDYRIVGSRTPWLGYEIKVSDATQIETAKLGTMSENYMIITVPFRCWSFW